MNIPSPPNWIPPSLNEYTVRRSHCIETTRQKTHMLSRKILLIVVGLLLVACGTEQQDDEGGPGFEGTWEPLPNLELSEYGLYASFDANERYLAWIEMYENQVFVYDLNADTLAHQISIPRGEGPGEVERLFSLAINENNNIFLTRQNDPRVLRLSATDTEDVDMLQLAEIPARIKPTGEDLVALTLNAPDKLMARLPTDGGSATTLGGDDLDMDDVFGPNPFLQAGYITVSDKHAVFSAQYMPMHVVYTLESNEHNQTITYEDVTDVRSNASSAQSQSGMQAVVPPGEVDLLLHNTAGVPNQSAQLAKLLEGEGGRNGSYSLDNLYIYDWTANEILNAIALPVTGKEVVSNSSDLFLYSEENHTVYHYVPDS